MSKKISSLIHNWWKGSEIIFSDIALFATGALAAGTSSAAPAYPANIVAGMGITLHVATRFQGSRPETPTGFRRVKESINWNRGNGSDQGALRVTTFWKEAAGTESGTVTINLVGPAANYNMITAQFVVFTKDPIAKWDVEVVGSASNNTASVDYSARAWNQMTLKKNDFLYCYTAVNTDSYTWDNQAISMTGGSFDTVTQEIMETANIQGNDSKHFASLFKVTSNASGFPIYAARSSGFSNVSPFNPCGVTNIVRLRQKLPIQLFGALSKLKINASDVPNATLDVVGGVWNQMMTSKEGTVTYGIENLNGVPHLTTTCDLSVGASGGSIQRRAEFHETPWMPSYREGSKAFLGFQYSTVNQPELPKQHIFLQGHTGSNGLTVPNYPLFYLEWVSATQAAAFGNGMVAGSLNLAYGMNYPAKSYGLFPSINQGNGGTVTHNFQVYVKYHQTQGRIWIKYNGTTIFDMSGIKTMATTAEELGDGVVGTGSTPLVGPAHKLGMYLHQVNNQADCQSYVTAGASVLKQYWKEVNLVVKDPSDIDYADEFDAAAMDDVYVTP